MKLLLLSCDAVICAVYGFLCFLLYPQDLGYVLSLLLFFLAARIISLSVHDAFSVINLALLFPLRHYQPLLLVLMYLLYTALYFFLFSREQKQKTLMEENTRLLIEAQQARHYRSLQERYENQIALNTRLQERQRIAQDIHDLLGHSVTASVFQLEAARKIMDQQPQQAHQMVGNATDNLRHGMEQIRGAVHQMRAAVPDLHRQEMDLLVERFRRDSGIQTSYQVKGEDVPTDTAMWETLHANLTEALSNVLRHANATEVEVLLQVLPGMVRLSVQDNGNGAKHLTEGMGFAGMRQRAAALGGSLIIRGEGGMSVITLLPRKGKHHDTCSHCG